MAEERKAAAVADKPKRPRETIQADLDAARAELRALRKQAEVDELKRVNQDRAIGIATAQWKMLRPGVPFDPHMFQPPLLPYPGEPAIHKAHHRQHYLIARLEEELAGTNELE